MDSNRIILKGDLKEKITVSVFTIGVFFIGFLILFLRMNSGKVNDYSFFGLDLENNLINNFILLFLCVVITLLSNILFTYIHEILHEYSAKRLGYKAWYEVEINWKYLSPKKAVCHFDQKEKIERNYFLLILMVPLITFCSMSIIIFMFENGILSLLVIVLISWKITGCSGDILMFIQAIIKSSRKDKLQYNGDKSFTIIKT